MGYHVSESGHFAASTPANSLHCGHWTILIGRGLFRVRGPSGGGGAAGAAWIAACHSASAISHRCPHCVQRQSLVSEAPGGRRLSGSLPVITNTTTATPSAATMIPILTAFPPAIYVVLDFLVSFVITSPPKALAPPRVENTRWPDGAEHSRGAPPIAPNPAGGDPDEHRLSNPFHVHLNSSTRNIATTPCPASRKHASPCPKTPMPALPGRNSPHAHTRPSLRLLRRPAPSRYPGKARPLHLISPLAGGTKPIRFAIGHPVAVCFSGI